MSAKNTYTEAVGRRKTATARVRIVEAKNPAIVVNDTDAAAYFPGAQLVESVYAPMKAIGASYAVTAKVSGGGKKAQATALQLGLARALVEADAERRKELKVRGFLTRDARAVERKKFGLRKARRAPQWSKR
ncbi:30S ribosomal protein S9 [Candidatus Kaiserbacteria bacterium CG10_big_fil_rev_8_21_14_0_10_59_10]|uniref:Small ribosomal subunit protein uS9 n=1 Tax=Candidatus Kaiserbacteria bacterium CG10_big_fil_rev_8_21_14_0_10_59_10 TaxID=1974612 RepID=A0A2H0U748_9BACT|nr:MAG: 30S ribosomal protein S9 [Candidatus Kaiserbacteria bacterium CG10_big_fil_rev_8_21_14_0_10_59_10]